MKEIAIDKAKKRMAEAGHYFMTLDGRMTFEQFNHRWSAFLNAINRAFLALSAGARDNAKTRAWWSEKKHEWKTDPLLQYLHQARNSDEHGLDALTEWIPGYFSAALPPGLNPASLSHPKLIAVRNDKFGDIFEPPTEHLGNKFSPEELRLPFSVAARAMGYYNRLILEAENYVA